MRYWLRGRKSEKSGCTDESPHLSGKVRQPLATPAKGCLTLPGQCGLSECWRREGEMGYLVEATISCIFEQFFVIKWDKESDVKSAQNQRNPQKNQRIQKIKNRILV